MTKRVLCLLTALVLAVCLGVPAGAEEIPGTVDLPQAGFRFVPPEIMRGTAGTVRMDAAAEIADGVWYAAWFYYAMTEVEIAAWDSDRSPDAPPEARICPLFLVLSIGNGMTFDNFNARNGNAIPAAYVREIGRLGDVTCCLYMEEPNPSFAEAIASPWREEYIALASAADQVAAAFTLCEREAEPDPWVAVVGMRLAFPAADLDGSLSEIADLFAHNEITVLNVWTTWCGPCIAELPALQALHDSLRERGCGVLGLLADSDTDAARALIADNGIAYPVLLGPDDLADILPLEYVPTTFLIGRDGTVLAAPIVGADAEAYGAAVERLLGGK